jgi:hypothetical protein
MARSVDEGGLREPRTDPRKWFKQKRKLGSKSGEPRRQLEWLEKLQVHNLWDCGILFKSGKQRRDDAKYQRLLCTSSI